MKWLCDHEKLVKQQLNEEIDSLTVKIRDDEKSTEVDWLESQHEVILKKESLMKLKKIIERLTIHEKEMISIKERRTRENKAKIKYKSVKSNDLNDKIDSVDEKDEDDEFLIEDYDDKVKEDDVKDDKKYPGVQVCRLTWDCLCSATGLK